MDRFYHVITPADSRMLAMADELGLAEEVRFRQVGAGFFADGEMHDFNGVGDLLRFEPLSPIARARLGWFVAQCQLRRGLRGARGGPAREPGCAAIAAASWSSGSGGRC